MSERPLPEPALSGPAYWVRLERDVITVSGPEAGTYLQGQLSQDVAALAPGQAAWSWLLAPNGKVDALLRVTRLQGDGWLLDTDAGWGDPVVARLQRFKLRTRADIAPAPATVIGVRGEDWSRLVSGAEPAAAVPAWPGMEGADLIYLGEDLPPVPDGPELPASAYEAVRLRAGQPRMGAELGERTIPGETGLVGFTVSFTKGCYTGQELVARIDSRGGNVPRHLCRLRLAAEVAPGTELFDGDTVAGTVTSVAPLAPADATDAEPAAAAAPVGDAGFGWAGLGYVKRAYQPPRRLSAGPDGPAAEIEALPW